MPLGRIGLWTHTLEPLPANRVRELAAELEELGYAAIWSPEAMAFDAVTHSMLLLAATKHLSVGTGIVPIYNRDPRMLSAAHRTIEEAYPERFVLGLGVSHQPMVETVLGGTYGPPVASMRDYLTKMNESLYFGAPPKTAPRRVLAALGPRMLALSGELADGALPYNTPPEHTATAREILGPDKLLAVEQKVVLSTGAAEARQIARQMLTIYLPLPNYANNWRRLGFTDDDLADGGSDRLVDAVVVWGTEDAIRARIEAHFDAGADHVCVQVLTSAGLGAQPVEEWRRLADPLLS